MDTKQILDNYKKRLINFSARNLTLCRSRITKKRAFDLSRLEENVVKDILLSVIKDTKKEINLLSVIDNGVTKKIRERVKDNFYELILTDKKIKLELDEKEINSLKDGSATKNLIKRAENLICSSMVEVSISDHHILSKDFNSLADEIDTKEKETGLYELYVGYPFVEGRLLDGTTVRAPLFIFPASLKKKDGIWRYQNLNDEMIYMNKALFIAYGKSFEKNMTKVMEGSESSCVEEAFGIEGKVDTIEEFTAQCRKFIEENNLNINCHMSKEVEIYRNYVKDSYSKYNDGELHLKNHLVLGQFSMAGNAMYKDYEVIFEEGFNLEGQVKSLLQMDKSIGEGRGVKEEPVIKEKESYFVTELDYSQEKAVKMAENLENLVVHGPPGTGKSQVIANIVSDHLGKNKKVLIVSEKRTALDVVYKRLEKMNLNGRLAFVHDTKKDRSKIMSKVISGLEDVQEWDENTLTDKVEKTASEIEEKLAKLDKLANEIHKKREFGSSLYKLYTNSKLDGDYFREFLTNKTLSKKIDYNELEKLIKELGSLREGIIYDSDADLLSKRKNFDTVGEIQLRGILKDLKELNRFTERKNIERIKEELGRIDVNSNDIFEKEMIDTKLLEKSGELLEEVIAYEKAFFLSIKKLVLRKKIKAMDFGSTLDEKKEVLKRHLEASGELNKLKKALEEKRIEEIVNLKDESSYLNFNLYRKEIEGAKRNIQNISDLLENLDRYFPKNDLEEILKETGGLNLEKLRVTLEEEFMKVKNYDIKKLEFRHTKFLKHLKENDCDNYLEKLKNSFYFNWIEESEAETENALSEIENYERLKDEALELIQKKKSYIPEYVVENMNKKVRSLYKLNRVGNEVNFREMRREAEKKRKVLPLRKYIETFEENGLFDLLPCWLMTPEVVSEVLPMKKGLFDVVIFDEASQLYVEKSIPSIYRSNSVVVAGDDKQLQPNIVGIARVDEETEDEEEKYEENRAAMEEVSLLDLSKQMYRQCMLTYHYRSKYPELINFSNYAFYEGNLITAPNKERLEKPPIERIKVDGLWEGQCNRIEAHRIYELVRELLFERKEEESIGIVTFNQKQRDYIMEYLEEKSEEDLEFRSLYEKEKIRYDDTEDMSIFIKNIENVQGDERDIIIFSTAYGKDLKTGKVASRFGSLGQSGGENRLNVAISRAKKKIYIVTSIEPEELRVENSKNAGPKLLKKYLQYTRAVSDRDESGAADILKSLHTMKKDESIVDDHFDSPFEEEVCSKLRNRGYEVHSQIGDSGYRIDLAIYCNKTSTYILGVECDGATYHSSPSARERDIYRQKFLEQKGWNIHRIWSKNWWRNPDKEIEKIMRVVVRVS